MHLLKKKLYGNLKRGMTSLEIVICVLVTIVAFCGYIDMSNIMNRMNVLSQNTGYITRVVGKQGGVRRDEIANFSGTYVTASHLYNNVKAAMNSAGIEDTEWRVYIDNQRLSPALNVSTKDYGSTIDVRVEVDYAWSLTENYVPLNLSGTKESTGRVFTTHKIRNRSY